ncbi:MAG: uncharacterized protein QOK43_565 [Acidimicrobiaceae bacterium]|jgi:uncharacterized protein (TIGR01777 family)|nr:uncharacterized protein [Acidimicrobiaceae bacterium]MDQ1446273.1 uncharacterized protein [Acidimicrobiaceae bacterium]
MRVLVTGSHGLIGTALVAALEADGDEVVRLSRGHQWEPESGTFDESALEGVDAVVHLAGEGIGEHRWSDGHKAKVLDSRVKGTTALATAAARRADQLRAFVSASAVGYYGDRGDEPLTEDSTPGQGFLADVCRQWEAATGPASKAGVRTVLVRSGIVLSPKGGALAKQLTPFRLGAGGRLGNGRQWQSWIAIDDEVGAIRHALDNEAVEGPLNATAPNPVTNAEFTKALGKVLGRPAVLAVPAAALRTMFGRGMADEMLLAGQRVLPAKLEATGYQFRHPTLDAALRAVLGKG